MSELAELHDELRGVARDLLARDVDAAARWRLIADAGWPGLEVPAELDGSGATFAETALVLEELGRAAAASPYVGTAVLAVGALRAVAASPGRDELLRDLATGSTLAAVALAPHADAAVAEAPFRLGADGRLLGRAALVLDAADATRLLLLADSDRGPVLAHVAAGDVVVEAAPLLDTTRSLASVEADGVAVAAEDVWPFTGEPSASAQAVLDRAALAIAVDAYGVAAAMLDATVEYAGHRRQFDRPIGSFQAVKHQCADALVQLRIGRELLDDAIASAAGGAPEPVATSRAASYLGDAAVSVVGTAMQLHGGIGYTWESGIHRFLKRALLDRALFGAPPAHRRRIADHRWPVGSVPAG